jgi:CRP-like cAMP-binding protein
VEPTTDSALAHRKGSRRRRRTERPSVYGAIRSRLDQRSDGSEDLWHSVGQRLKALPAGADLKGVWATLSEIVDPAEFRPQLAPDIELKEFKLRGGNDYAVIANPRDLIHYRLEPAETELVKLMDGSRTVKEIVVERFQESGDLELSGVADLVSILYEGNFLDRRFVDVPGAVKRALNPISVARQKGREFMRTLTIEWQGAHRLVRWLHDHGLKWFFNRWAQILGALVAVSGLVAFVAIARSHRFTLTGESPVIGILVLLVLDYFMVFVHELGHALVLVHQGRRVKNAGFQIYFGAPTFFVDTSDGLMLEARQRIVESFGGPYAQMLIGGISALVSFAFPEWVLSETMYRYAVLNYLVLSMNLIPLLELDGYWIFSEVIQEPELRPKSLSFIRHDLWHKLRNRLRFSRLEVGLAVYGIIGVAFSILSFYTAYFYWRSIFGSLVSRLWNGGAVTRGLLIVLALFVLGPVIRGLVNFIRTLGRRVRDLWRNLQWRLEQGWRVEAAELIDDLPMFEDLPAEVLDDLAGRVQLRSVARGEPVIRQGERAQSFYIVRSGTLRVVEENPETGNESVLRVLGRGESFGELGLVEGARRAATVRAVEDAQVFEIDKGTFDRLLADMIHVPDFAPTFQAIADLRELPSFSHLEPDELAELLNHGAWASYPPGEEIVVQGQPADAFYAIGSGQVEVLEDGRQVARLGPGSYFGEIALLMDSPRTATVRSTTPARAYRLDREGFDRLVAGAFKRGTLDPSKATDRTLHH